MVKIGFKKIKTVNNGKKKSNMFKNGQKWPKLLKKLLNMVKSGQNCQKRSKTVNNGQKQ